MKSVPERTWYPWIGWREISREDALELGLEQAARYKWELLGIEWFGYGITFVARSAQPNRKEIWNGR